MHTILIRCCPIYLVTLKDRSLYSFLLCLKINHLCAGRHSLKITQVNFTALTFISQNVNLFSLHEKHLHFDLSLARAQQHSSKKSVVLSCGTAGLRICLFLKNLILGKRPVQLQNWVGGWGLREGFSSCGCLCSCGFPWPWPCLHEMVHHLLDRQGQVVDLPVRSLPGWQARVIPNKPTVKVSKVD